MGGGERWARDRRGAAGGNGRAPLVTLLAPAVVAGLAARASTLWRRSVSGAASREDGAGTAPPPAAAPEGDLVHQMGLVDRAIGRARNSVIITDCGRPGLPIVYANEAFLALTGYAAKEVIGRNCRFLQGPATDPAARDRLRDAIGRGEGIHVEIQNYRKDGTPFWNDLLISPIHDERGRMPHFIGNQIDATARKRAEEALRAERASLERRVAERTEALRAREAYQASIVETMREALLVLDEELRVVSANRAFHQQFRCSPEEIEGRSLFALADGRWDVPGLRALLGEVLPRRRTVEEFRVDQTFPGLGRRTLLLNARPVELDGTAQRRILLAMEDTTDRHSAQRSSAANAALTEAVLSSLDAHIAVVDREGAIIAVNDAWIQFAELGEALDERAFLGVNYLEVLRRSTGPDAAESPAALRGIEAILAGETPRFSLEYPCDIPSAQLWFLLQVTPLKHAGGGAVVAHVDITDRKLIEQRKDDFIGMASHELKTPITGMKLQTQSLGCQFARRGETTAAERLARMDGQIDKLSRLVQELLDVSRIHAGKLVIRADAFDLRALLDETVEANRPTAPAHRLTVTPGEPCPIVADRDRIEQVVINLLTNAVKFSPNDEAVVAEVEAVPGGAQLSVRDRGMGIDPTHHARIFDRFYQATEATEVPLPGLGMGLYISREIVALHGGRIWVESAPGRGSTLRVFLPVAPPAGAAPGDEATAR